MEAKCYRAMQRAGLRHARGELRSTLSRAGSCRCRRAKECRQNWDWYAWTICMAEMLTKRKGLPDRRMAEMLTKRKGR